MSRARDTADQINRVNSSAADATAITVDSSENVGIGTSSPSSYYSTDLVVTVPDEGGITLVNDTTHTSYLMFADGTSGADRYRGQLSYDHNVNEMAFATNGNERMRITTDKVQFNVDAKVDADNSHDLGSGGARWKDLYLSGGIYLGGTGSANKLDDYEEGTHSATFAMNGSGSISMLRQNLAYIKVGRLVTVTGEVSVSSVSSPVGSMTMTLPFTISAAGTARDTFIGSKPVAYRVPHNQDNTPVIIGNTVNAQVTFLYEQDNAPFADYTPAANATFNISFSYLTTA